jgi:hypothetical protein
VSEWVSLQRARKFELAGKTANNGDGKWSTRLLPWKPWFRADPRRNVGRPKRRWEDDLVKLAGENWMTEATEDSLWASLKTGYIEKVM